MRETADIVIVGGGIIGLCTAWQLSRRSAGKIIVLEKGAGPGEGSTGASSAVCRFKYSRAETVRLAQDGIGAYRHWADFLKIAKPLATFHSTGVVWMGTGDAAAIRSDVARLGALGIRVEALDDAGLSELYPALSPCPLSPDLETGELHDCGDGGAHLLELDGGYVDPMDALQDLYQAVRARGIQIIMNAEVTDVLTSGGAISGLRTSHGAIATSSVVNAAGPWCERINDLAGLETKWPLKATRIQVVHLDRPDGLQGSLPVCADPAGGIYFRPQNRGQQIVVGSVREEDEREIVDPDRFDRGVDDLFAAKMVHALSHRLPGLGEPRNVRGYSGLYTMNTADLHPVVGVTPVTGFFVANGFSGHGFKLAPAIGSLLAQVITGIQLADDTNIGPDFLSFCRKPLANVMRSVLA